jgi:hypothetical protein
VKTEIKIKATNVLTCIKSYKLNTNGFSKDPQKKKQMVED